MFELFRKGKVFTIPNLMSFFRILLVPVIIWSYLGLHSTTLSIILLAISALTDVLDGQIARRFHMVSDLGKALDPLADKLTQASIVLCLAFERPLMWILLGLCVIREPTMGILGYITFRKTGVVQSARWYGKVSTVVLYGSALALLIFPSMPAWLSTALIVLCMVCVLSALILYARFFHSLWKQADAASASQTEA